MMEVYCDRGTVTIRVAKKKPEDPVQLTSKIVFCWLNIRAGDKDISCTVGKARGQGGKGWLSYSLIKPRGTFDVNILVGVVGTELTISNGGIRNQLVSLDVLVQSIGCLSAPLARVRGFCWRWDKGETMGA